MKTKPKLNPNKGANHLRNRKIFGIATCVVLCFAIIASCMAVRLAYKLADRGIRTGITGLTILSQMSQMALLAAEETLANGTNDQRIQILHEIAKVNFSTSGELPEGLISGVQANLMHDNTDVRNAAALAFKAIAKSPKFTEK